MSTATDPRELRAQLDQHIATISAELADKEREAAKAEDKRRSIMARTVNADALIARAHASIDIVADGYLQKIAFSIGEALQRPPTVADMMQPIGKASPSLYVPLRGARSFLGDYNDEPLSQEAATFLFRDAMKAAAEQAIRAASLPRETHDGLSIDEARANLEAVDAKLRKLHERIGELRAQLAELAGEPAAI